MRILFLTNFYPPYELGGQGRSCQQAVEGMKERGHSVMVLTSMHGTDNQSVQDEDVYRCLYLEMDMVPLRHSLVFFTQRKQRVQHNLAKTQQILTDFQPDVVFIWGMWNLSHALPELIETQMARRVVYRFAEYWPTLPSQHELYWRAPAQSLASRIVKTPLSRVALFMLAQEAQPPQLKFDNVICVSAATRDVLVKGGVPVADARIIHTGIEITDNPCGAELDEDETRDLKLLYAGRLSADKGVETTIEAMEHLVHKLDMQQVKLSLAGSGSEEYMRHLRELVARADLENYVTFLGWVPHEEMPQLMCQFDAALVPSKWPEPFARVVLEGMSFGLVVIATPSGGTSEIIRNKENGLLFTSGDFQDLAQAVTYIAANPEFRHKLRNTGRKTVREQFTITKMLDAYEAFLKEAAGVSS